MSRRIIPATFLALFLSAVVLPLAVHVEAFGLGPRVPSVQGTWDGFLQDLDDPGTPDLVRSFIVQQDNRRIQGDALLLDLDGRTVFNAINIEATLARDDFITGTGRTLTGRLVFQAGLETFEGAMGDAGVMQPDFHFVPVQARAASILLHPFPAVNPPDIAGIGMGTFRSASDPSFRGELALDIFPPVRGSFPGSLLFLPAGGSPRPYHLLATSSDDGRIIMIGLGAAGKRLVVDGAARPPQDGVTPVDGLYRISLGGQVTDFGAYNFNIAAPLR